MDDIGSITFTFINNVCINLSGLYIRMSKHSFNGIDVGITFELQSCEGMTGCVENIIHLRNWKNIENKPVTGCELVDFLYFTSVAEKQSGMEY